MKKTIDGMDHYIVYALYKGENLKEMDFNVADWYETLRDALDEVAAIREATWLERLKACEAGTRDLRAIEYKIMAVDVGPGVELWTDPIEIDCSGWPWSDDMSAMVEMNESHLDRSNSETDRG